MITEKDTRRKITFIHMQMMNSLPKGESWTKGTEEIIQGKIKKRSCVQEESFSSSKNKSEARFKK